MSLVTLTDGTQAEQAYVNVIEGFLRQLLQIDEPTLLQLKMKCEDPNYRFLANAAQTLSQYGLLENDTVPEPIKRIVMCAVQEDRNGMRIVSAIAQTS